MQEDTRSVREIADAIRAYGQSSFSNPVQVDSRGNIISGRKVIEACRMLGLPSVAAELVLAYEGLGPPGARCPASLPGGLSAAASAALVWTPFQA